MAIEPATLSLEACHQCGLPSLTFDDFETPISSPDPSDIPVDSPAGEEPTSEDFLPAANF